MDDLDRMVVLVPLRLLLMLEWHWSEGTQVCKVCREGYKYGHRSDCELAKAIRDAGGDVRIQKEAVTI